MTARSGKDIIKTKQINSLDVVENGSSNLALNVNGSAGELLFRLNNTDNKSVVLKYDASYKINTFSPYTAANNNICLGRPNARWQNIYATSGNFSKTLHVWTGYDSNGDGNYTQGIRLYAAANKYSLINFGCITNDALSGINVNQWAIGRDSNNEFIFRSNTDSTGTLDVLKISQIGDISPTGNVYLKNTGKIIQR